MLRTTWSSGGTRVVLTLAEEVLTAEHTGPLTCPTWKGGAAAAAQWAGHRCAGVLVDMSRALVAMTADEMRACALPKSVLSRLPGALVVPATQLELFRALSWGLAQEGVERAVFTAPPPALVWLHAAIRKRRARAAAAPALARRL